MHTNKIASLLALALLTTALAPLAAAEILDPDHIERVRGPAGVVNKDFGNTAIAFCQLVEPALPAACDPTPGTIPAIGGAFFVVDGTDPMVPTWNPPGTEHGRIVDINVELIDGQSLGGFAAFACTDFNDDIECDSGTVGYAHDSCETGKDKDDKDEEGCDDPSDLGLRFCAERDWSGDPAAPTYDPTGYDDFVVFIEWWNDVQGIENFDDSPDNTDTGLSIGEFEVAAKWTGLGFVDLNTCNDWNTVLDKA